jgi:Outer membrane protein beta-barrel domain
LVLQVPTKAQVPAKPHLSLGIASGIVRNYLLTNPAYRLQTKYQGANGFIGGLQINYRFSTLFSLLSEPSYVGKNYRIVRTGYYQGVFQSFHNHYIQLPVMAGFAWEMGKIQIQLNAGGYMAYWISGRMKGAIPNIGNLTSAQDTAYTNVFQEFRPWSYDQKYQFSDRDNRMEIGFVTGFSMIYTLQQRYHFSLSARFYNSLTGLQRNYSLNQQNGVNETFAIVTGCAIEIGKCHCTANK